MGSPKGRDTDDELSLVARRGQSHHAIFIVKEYKMRPVAQ